MQFFINNNSNLFDNILIVSNWRTLISIRDFLDLFFQIIKYTKKQHAIIDKKKLLLDFLLDKYKIDAFSHIVVNFIKLSIDTK